MSLLDGVRRDDEPARLLFVHAHPDDETLTTGVAIGHHVARGDDVHVLTCTLGEEGEVIPEPLAHLEGEGESLAAHRRRELAAAMEVLGVTHHLLGADGPDTEPAYRDSGMAGSPAAEHPRAWAGADLAGAAAVVRSVVERIRPDVVVTYDASGGYGHPDHVRTHEATRRAVADLAVSAEPGEPGAPLLLGALTPLSWASEDHDWLVDHVPHGQGWVVPGGDNPYAASVVPDEVVTRAVVDPAAAEVRTRALREYETQVVVGDGWYALSNRYVFRLGGREGYAVLDPATGRPVPEGAP
jgi:N-acetyl-1-D-myo-inositol-2-amino-2-deoxy-alpha-D-glucopyranoside deacetylase